MAFSYNGLIYRDLEDQVRYDAEQVQLLKQADVTINENLQTVNESLQTVNTEINGKLTKPVNPSAESAVTMLADGTVGTKPLSEIGGKLYNHTIYFFISGNSISAYINVITSSSTPFTQISEFKSLINNKVAIIVSDQFCGAVEVTTNDYFVLLRGGGVKGADTTQYAILDVALNDSNFNKDTVTEL